MVVSNYKYVACVGAFLIAHVSANLFCHKHTKCPMGKNPYPNVVLVVQVRVGNLTKTKYEKRIIFQAIL